MWHRFAENKQTTQNHCIILRYSLLQQGSVNCIISKWNKHSHSFDNKDSITLTSSISIRAVWDDIHSEASRIVSRCFQGANK